MSSTRESGSEETQCLRGGLVSLTISNHRKKRSVKCPQGDLVSSTATSPDIHRRDIL